MYVPSRLGIMFICVTKEVNRKHAMLMPWMQHDTCVWLQDPWFVTRGQDQKPLYSLGI